MTLIAMLFELFQGTNFLNLETSRKIELFTPLHPLIAGQTQNMFKNFHACVNFSK